MGRVLSLRFMTEPDEDEQEVVRAVLAAASHHERLGLPPTFTDDARLVRQRYRERARRVHPDKCRHPDAPRAFRALTDALECLLDAQAQTLHLASLRQQPSAPRSAYASAGPRPRSGSSRSATDAKAYADAVHAARRGARHQRHQQRQREHDHQRKRTTGESPDGRPAEAAGGGGAKRRARASHSVPFDYSTEGGAEPRPKKKPQRSSSAAFQQRQGADEETGTRMDDDAAAAKSAAGWVCDECGRRFAAKATYDGHLLFGSLNHRYRGRASSSAASAPIFASGRADEAPV